MSRGDPGAGLRLRSAAGKRAISVTLQDPGVSVERGRRLRPAPRLALRRLQQSRAPKRQAGTTQRLSLTRRQATRPPARSWRMANVSGRELWLAALVRCKGGWPEGEGSMKHPSGLREEAPLHSHNRRVLPAAYSSSARPTPPSRVLRMCSARACRLLLAAPPAFDTLYIRRHQHLVSHRVLPHHSSR